MDANGITGSSNARFLEGGKIEGQKMLDFTSKSAI